MSDRAPDRQPRRAGPLRRGAALAALILVPAVLSACTQPVGELNAVLRGDQAFARGAVEEALAEYRLALLQGEDEAPVYARVAHTFALQGRVDDAADSYQRAAELDSAYADQAVADLVRLARSSAQHNDLFGVASAVQRALEFRPGLSVDDLALPLARHYGRSGQPGRALPFYQKALGAVSADSAPAIMNELAEAYEEVGDCGRALVFYEQYAETVPRWRRGEVNWHLGNCSYRYAQTLKEEGKLADALRHVERTIELEEPRNLLALAHFERGQILSLLGDCEEALEAYQAVREADVAGSGPLVSRAQRRVDELRFGGMEDAFAPRQRCGLPLPDYLDPDEMPDSLWAPDTAPGDTLRGLRRP